MESRARDLEKQLEAARARSMDANQAALDATASQRPAAFLAALSAREVQLALERELAHARGEPACFPLPWEIPWDGGAPCPHVVSSGRSTALVYYVGRRSPDWRDGRLAIAEFEGCYGHRFGGPNDEVLEGHPFFGRGINYYDAYLLAPSPWLAAERDVNRVHSQFRPESWERLKHYLLLFHDQQFECLAVSHRVELSEHGLAETLASAMTRVRLQG